MKKFINYNSLNGPLLDSIKVNFEQNAENALDFKTHPFSLPLIQNLTEIVFPTNVTFFVGENGTGKSTILEAIAHKAGFGAEGGSKNIQFKTSYEHNYSGTEQFAECLTLSWRFKPKNGYFFRAESFYNVANRLEYIAREAGGGDATYTPYGGKSLHEQSHGESFLSFFTNRLGDGGFFIFDEPEAALSPQRQLTLLVILHQMAKSNSAQFIIATHSPILLAFPHATIYSCDGKNLERVTYEETQHYQITKRFLDSPERYFAQLFQE